MAERCRTLLLGAGAKAAAEAEAKAEAPPGTAAEVKPPSDGLAEKAMAAAELLFLSQMDK